MIQQEQLIQVITLFQRIFNIDLTCKCLLGWVARRNQFGGMVRNEEKQVDEFVYNTNNHTYVGLLKTNLPEMSWLPNPCNLKIDIEKNSSDFCLHSASEVDAKIVLENIELRILTYTLADPLYKTLMEKISTEPLKYDYHRADLDIYSIPTGTRYVEVFIYL